MRVEVIHLKEPEPKKGGTDKCPYCYFHRRNNTCGALSDTHFDGRECPFFKTPKEKAESDHVSRERLLKIGKQKTINTDFFM